MSRRDVDLRIGAGFAALRAESAVPARREAVAGARAAMYRAVIEAQDPHTAPLATRIRRAVLPHRVLGGVTGAAMALGAVTALGWNAPAGSPLHIVEVAHEQIALVLPGTDRAAADLGYAESRLDQAVQGNSADDALDEAQRLLDDARGHLPGDHAAPAWGRWQRDSNRLAALRADHGHEPQAPGNGFSGPGGSTHAGSAPGRPTTTTTTTTGTTHTNPGRGSEDSGGNGGSSPNHDGRNNDGSNSSGGDGGGSQSHSTHGNAATGTDTPSDSTGAPAPPGSATSTGMPVPQGTATPQH